MEIGTQPRLPCVGPKLYVDGNLLMEQSLGAFLWYLFSTPYITEVS
jgi:hypothetical protein